MKKLIVGLLMLISNLSLANWDINVDFLNINIEAIRIAEVESPQSGIDYFEKEASEYANKDGRFEYELSSLYYEYDNLSEAYKYIIKAYFLNKKASLIYSKMADLQMKNYGENVDKGDLETLYNKAVLYLRENNINDNIAIMDLEFELEYYQKALIRYDAIDLIIDGYNKKREKRGEPAFSYFDFPHIAYKIKVLRILGNEKQADDLAIKLKNNTSVLRSLTEEYTNDNATR
ncbi:hypothetical protein [Marinicellulosiphila megalodicopiae]|uniref:hypothetical protein n=1 Tax=Marinicellulosiphila megalodicopiae TaxID=2724896 RepID=UPI003BAE9B3D